jgi:hypothetical protein
MIYSRADLDDNFKDLIVKKTKRIKDMYSFDYQNKIKIDKLHDVGLYFVDLKPKSKKREYKKSILNYFDELIAANKELSDKDIGHLNDRYLSSVFSHLNDKYDFLLKGTWIYIGIYGFIIDIVAYLIGIGKYYYYIPIFAISILIVRFIKERRAKKNGKLIDF